MKQICINVPDSVYLDIQEKCTQSGYTQEYLIKEAILKHLDLVNDLLIARKIIMEERIK